MSEWERSRYVVDRYFKGMSDADKEWIHSWGKTDFNSPPDLKAKALCKVLHELGWICCR